METEENTFDIPVSGNLGLLALGYRGVVAWRKVRDEAMRRVESERTNKE
jgi:hypothetical protein